MSKQIYMNAVVELNKDIKELQEAINKKKQAVNVMYESMGEQPLYEIEGETKINHTMRPDLFYGRSFATVAAEFLKMRKQACSAIEITEGLTKGGFDFPWREDDRLRNVAISLSKNSQLFQKLPNNTFGLLEWYPTKKRSTSKAGELINKLNGENIESEPATEAGNLSNEEDNTL